MSDQVVQPAMPGRLECGRGLADQPAHLVGRGQAGPQQVGEAVRADPFADDVGEPVLDPDVEDPLQPGSSTPAARRAASSDVGAARVAGLDHAAG